MSQLWAKVAKAQHGLKRSLLNRLQILYRVCLASLFLTPERNIISKLYLIYLLPQGPIPMLDRHIVAVAKNGRMNLPSALRSKLDLSDGGKIVFIEKENGEVEVTTLRRSLKRAQELVRQSIPADVDLVGDLIKERRAEALGEAESGK